MTFEDLLGRQPGHDTVDNSPVTCRVVRVSDPGPDDLGVAWVVPIDGDMRHPIGPCRAGRMARVDDLAVLIWADGDPWIVVDRPAEADAAVLRASFAADGDLLVGTGPSAFETRAKGGPGTVLTTTTDDPTHVRWETSRDTDDVVLAAPGTIAGHPGLTVTVRRVDNTVAVQLVETIDATASGAVTLGTLLPGFEMLAPTGGVAAVASAYDPSTQSPVGTVVVLAGGTVRLHGVSGARHCAGLVGVTGDAWPVL